MKRLYPLIFLFIANAVIGSTDIYNSLRSTGLLDPYLGNLVQGIASNVVSGSGKSRTVQINRPHRKGHLNIYMVDVARLKVEPLAHLEINIRPAYRNFLAHRDSESIFIDSGFLRELVTLNLMFWEQEINMHQALAAYTINGKQAYRNYWDPMLNPMLNAGDAGQYWLVSLRGVIAFLIAHELGHIDLTPDPQTDFSKPFRPKTPREGDLFWSCPELVYREAVHWRAAETAADEYALQILSRVGGLRYEHGAQWYLVYLLNLGMINAIPLASPTLTPFLQQRYGGALEQLRSASALTRGPIEMFYPKSHPNVLLRLSNAMAYLYNESPDPLMYIWNERIKQECENLN